MNPEPNGAHEVTERIQESVQARFSESERVLSFDEFLRHFLDHPAQQLRTAPQYVLDMIDYYGIADGQRVGQSARRFRVFDRQRGTDSPGLTGQEGVQERIYRILQAFAKRGKAERMVLCHGPNGSGKTTIIECLSEGLEDYSRTDDGVLYTFNWIFTDREGRLDRIGFDNEPKDFADLDTFAHLEERDITSRISSELRDHPIFLIPKRWRTQVIADAIEGSAPEKRPNYPYDYYLDGGLSHKSKKIYDTLLVAYQGDWRKVVRHIQVERFFISKRYRIGAVSIEPQGNIDATSRPIQHESAWSIPSLLRNTSLYEPVGDIVDANRGILEYSDFLKRPQEANKYLLTTCERGTVNLSNCMAYLDLVIFGTSNEKQLNLFKRSPEFSSFKGRIELIPVPYLLRFSAEAVLYEAEIAAYAQERHVTPHVTKVTALWAVLTRLRRPNAKHYRRPVSTVVTRLTPMEKAKLYDSEEAPSRFSEEDRKLLRSHLLEIRQEFDEAEGEFEGIYGAEYEGRRGASPREMLSLLAQAGDMETHRCLTPMDVFELLESLTKDASIYDFLRLAADGDYHNVRKALAAVRQEYIHWVTDEVYESIDLVEESEYDRFFLEYFRYVKASHMGESVYNAATNTHEPPEEEVMTRVERLLDNTDDAKSFRSEIITRIAAWSLDHPQEEIPYQTLFPEIYEALRENFYKERDRLLTLIEEDILKYGTDEFDLLSQDERDQVLRSLDNMQTKYGYCEHCARDVIAYVLKYRAQEKATKK